MSAGHSASLSLDINSCLKVCEVIPKRFLIAAEAELPFDLSVLLYCLIKYLDLAFSASVISSLVAIKDMPVSGMVLKDVLVLSDLWG